MKRLSPAFAMLAGSLVLFGGFAYAHAQSIGVTTPTVPTDVTAVATPFTGGDTVSWTASTESQGAIVGYYIYRNGGAVSSTAGTSFTDGGLVSGVYTYAVAAYDASGNVSQQSQSFSVSVTADTMPPTAPTGLTVSGATTTNPYSAPAALTISWNASTDNVGVVGYNVYRNGTLITSSTPPFDGTSITDSVMPGTYVYDVDAYDAAGNVSTRSTVSVTVFSDYTAPTTPTGLVVQQTGPNEVTLTWNSSTDNYGVSGYQIFRNGVWIASSTTTSYQDASVSTDTPYSYMLTAYDAAGNISPQSPSVNAYVQQTDGPTAPLIGQDMLVGTSSVQLFWSIPNDPIAIANYTVYRDGTIVATVTSTNYLDEGLSPGIHFYNVAATDVSGAVSPISATSTITISNSPAPAATASSPSTTGTSSPSTASGISAAATTFTQSLYYGIRTSQVTALQSLLAANGYMSPAYATGFFGSITLKAVENFQCGHAIACSGDAGWGTVGPKTRAALNALEQGVTVNATSTAAQFAELQALEAELAALQKQL